MQEWIDFIKAIIRPFIIIWGLVVYGICVLTGTEVPPLLAALVTAVIIEYSGERAIFRFRENSGERKGDR
jgi:hypothetical protein